MAPSANGQKAASVQHTVYIVERRAEFRELNSQIDPNSDQNAYEPEISYLDFAYQDEKQAYAVAIREQILELDGDYSSHKHNGRKIAAQTNLSLKERLKRLHKEVEVDVGAGAHEVHEPVVKFEVLEFPVTAVQPFQEAVFLNELGHESESEDIEDEEEEDLGDDDDDEEDEEEEEGVEEPEDEEPDAEDYLEELDDDDEGAEVDDEDDDDDDDDSDGAPQTKRQRK